MATNSAGNNARHYPQSMVHYIGPLDITYATANIGTDATVEVGELPEGASILETQVIITEAFNAGTTNVIKAGTSSNDDAFVEAGDVDETATGSTRIGRGADLGVLAAATKVFVTYDETGNAASAGAARVLVFYCPANG